METFIRILPLALIFAGIFTLLYFLFVRFVARLRVYHGLMGFAVFFALAYSCLNLLIETPNYNLAKQNATKLTAWQEAGCVHPDLIKESVFVVRSEGQRGYGTAFYLEGGVIVSNRHIAERHPLATLYRRDGSSFEAAAIYVADKDSRPDLAFYDGAVVLNQITPLPLAAELPQVGDRLLVLGHNRYRKKFHPAIIGVHGVGRYTSVPSVPRSWMTKVSAWAYGIYRKWAGKSSRAIDRGARKAFVIKGNGDTAGGNSGSPVVNCQGQVVGVHYAGNSFFWFARERSSTAVAFTDLLVELESFRHQQNQFAHNNT